VICWLINGDTNGACCRISSSAGLRCYENKAAVGEENKTSPMIKGRISDFGDSWYRKKLEDQLKVSRQFGLVQGFSSRNCVSQTVSVQSSTLCLD
jgi:hypothetical protein